MKSEQNKKIVDELFKNIEKETNKSGSKNSENPKNNKLDKKIVSINDLLCSYSEDYENKLGITLDLKNKSDMKFTDLIDALDGLPFMAHSMNIAIHYTNKVERFGRLANFDVSSVRKNIIVPILMTCAGVVSRIHQLPDAPDLDTDGFDTLRLNLESDGPISIVNHICEFEINNRQKWIAMACFDATTVLVNSIVSIVSEHNITPMIAMLFKMTLPSLSSLTAAYMKNMVITSQELDKL
jgi:hypothetical protein